MSKKHLVQYIREGNRPVGAMVAVKSNKGKIMVTWSKVKVGYDTFSKKMAKLEALKKINDGNAYEIKNNIYLCMGDAERLPYIFEVKENGKSFVDVFVERVNNYYNNTKTKKPEKSENPVEDTLVSNGDYTLFFSTNPPVVGKVCFGRYSYTKPYYNFDKKEWQHTAKNCWISLEEMKEYLVKYKITKYDSKIV